MDRTEWLESLTKMFGQHPDVAKHVASLLPNLADIPDERFTPASLGGVHKMIRSAASPIRIRNALNKWWLLQGETPVVVPRAKPVDTVLEERAAIAARHDELKRDWDNTGVIRRCVALCGGNVLLLSLLRGIVNRWAPQHNDIIPPTAGGSLDWDAG
jgi:hypothetical protein